VYEISANQRANRLQIEIAGNVSAADIDDAAKVAVDAARKLDDGFDVITDISGFRPPSPEAAKPIKRAQKQLVEMGVDRVVRVADEDTSQVVVNAFERRSRDVGYSGETASTVEEAERLLADETVTGHR